MEEFSHKKIMIDMIPFHNSTTYSPNNNSIYEVSSEYIEDVNTFIPSIPMLEPPEPPITTIIPQQTKNVIVNMEYKQPRKKCGTIAQLNMQNGMLELLHNEPNEKKDTSKKQKERVVVANWIFENEHLTFEYQYKLIEQLYQLVCCGMNINNTNELAFITSQINNKKNGYKQQDIEKQLYVCNEFVDFSYIIELLYQSKLCCYYCGEHVHILYKYVREPKQWSLERIFNERGHNIGNVKIACLCCNLRRKTMHYQKYLDTKKMTNIVKINND